MKVLSVTPEIFPLIKTGGLADVTGALPMALAKYGVEMRSLVPGYPVVMEAVTHSTPVKQYDALFGGRAALLETNIAGLDLFILDAPHLYDRSGGPVWRCDRRRLAGQLAAFRRIVPRRRGYWRRAGGLRSAPTRAYPRLAVGAGCGLHAFRPGA